MNYQEKIAKKREKIVRIEAEIQELLAEFRSVCAHEFEFVRRWDDDDGYSRRECTAYAQYRCVHCGKNKTETTTFQT